MLPSPSPLFRSYYVVGGRLNVFRVLFIIFCLRAGDKKTDLFGTLSQTGHYFTPVMLYFRSFFKTFKLFVFIEAPLVCIIGHLQSLSTYIRILKTQTAFDNYPKNSGFLDDYSGFLDDYSVGLITLLFFFLWAREFLLQSFPLSVLILIDIHFQNKQHRAMN